MDNVNATQARSELFRLMDEVADNHRPILITGDRHNSVLILETSYLPKLFLFLKIDLVINICQSNFKINFTEL
ncbi:hypothetical protein BWK47_14100 [Synechocystis sp. CACIAM 05]|nr:hypothetical protein BWK47_14100 [Synechocystis sp. CACIAM 05]